MIFFFLFLKPPFYPVCEICKMLFPIYQKDHTQLVGNEWAVFVGKSLLKLFFIPHPNTPDEYARDRSLGRVLCGLLSAATVYMSLCISALNGIFFPLFFFFGMIRCWRLHTTSNPILYQCRLPPPCLCHYVSSPVLPSPPPLCYVRSIRRCSSENAVAYHP